MLGSDLAAQWLSQLICLGSPEEDFLALLVDICFSPHFFADVLCQRGAVVHGGDCF